MICLCTLSASASSFRTHGHTVVCVRGTECAEFCLNICDFVCTGTNKEDGGRAAADAWDHTDDAHFTFYWCADVKKSVAI